MDFQVRGALQALGARWEQGPASSRLSEFGETEGGVERGAREKKLVPSTACRLLASPGIGAWSERFGQRAGEKLRYGHPTRAGGCQGGAGGSQGLWRPQPHNAVLETSRTPGRLFLPIYSLSLPLLAQCPAHLAAGRGAPQEGRRGAPGRLSRMLRGREPCSCHGRSSLCSAPAPAPAF